MKRKRFSVEQIVAVLKQAELGMPVADVVRQMGLLPQIRSMRFSASDWLLKKLSNTATSRPALSNATQV
jgi:hypothetical protein